MKSRFKPLNQRGKRNKEDKTDNGSDNIKGYMAPATRLAAILAPKEAMIAVMVVPILSPKRTGRAPFRSIK